MKDKLGLKDVWQLIWGETNYRGVFFLFLDWLLLLKMGELASVHKYADSIDFKVIIIVFKTGNLNKIIDLFVKVNRSNILLCVLFDSIITIGVFKAINHPIKYQISELLLFIFSILFYSLNNLTALFTHYLLVIFPSLSIFRWFCS